jgi:hypothetical protein
LEVTKILKKKTTKFFLRKFFLINYFRSKDKTTKIYVALHEDVSSMELLIGYFIADYIRQKIHLSHASELFSPSGQFLKSNWKEEISKEFSEFFEGLKGSGWNVQRVLLSPDQWRLNYKNN